MIRSSLMEQTYLPRVTYLVDNGDFELVLRAVPVSIIPHIPSQCVLSDDNNNNDANARQSTFGAFWCCLNAADTLTKRCMYVCAR